MEIEEESYLEHYGTPRHSGRYPWGSSGWGDGEPDPSSHRNPTLLDEIARLEAQGLKPVEVARGLGMSTTELRVRRSNEKARIKAENVAMAQRLRDKGMSTAEIARRMQASHSTVTTWLAPGAAYKSDTLHAVANMLEEQVKLKEWIDVGKGVERHIGITEQKLKNALTLLKDRGFQVHSFPIHQITTGQKTRALVLGMPGTTQRDAFLNSNRLQQIDLVSSDKGKTFTGTLPPLKIDPNRVGVRYKSDGGGEADGVIFIRPGVPDVSLGGTAYSQVRVAVGDNHYLKGMAVYKDDLPEGVDLLFNTNKDDTGNKLDAMKKNGDDPENPFGAFISRQVIEHPGTPEARVTSVMNAVNDEGDWEEWSKTLSSQMLSKQSPSLVKTQLDLTNERAELELEEINRTTNPVVRKRLLEKYAESTDAAAAHLKAASLPRQSVRVILPLSSIKKTEVYAPRFENGERVVLIRHPHSGPFEIPELTVNNRNREGQKLLGRDSRDAVGIHHDVASQLSGADFDGDTVLVIPNRTGKVRVDTQLEGLKNFDPVRAYPGYEGMKPMGKRQTQTEMGSISNLITDMSLAGAPLSEIAAAVRHSMVVIDAHKKELNYRQSYIDNGIGNLKKKYQSRPDSHHTGASTLISRAGSELRVPERRPRSHKEGGPINTTTGALEFTPTGKVDKRTGKPTEQKTTKLAEASDARSLLSAHPKPIERLYADHSNRLKALANKARLESLGIVMPKQSKTARETFAKERASLEGKLNLAIRNAPLERQAQIIANAQVGMRFRANRDLDDDDKRKIKFQQLAAARARMGANKDKIVIEPDEWTAIQAGAISAHKLGEILNHADIDQVRKLATPRTERKLSSTMIERANQMFDDGYDLADIAKQLGVSVSTLENARLGDGNG